MYIDPSEAFLRDEGPGEKYPANTHLLALGGVCLCVFAPERVRCHYMKLSGGGGSGRLCVHVNGHVLRLEKV